MQYKTHKAVAAVKLAISKEQEERATKHNAAILEHEENVQRWRQEQLPLLREQAVELLKQIDLVRTTPDAYMTRPEMRIVDRYDSPWFYFNRRGLSEGDDMTVKSADDFPQDERLIALLGVLETTESPLVSDSALDKLGYTAQWRVAAQYLGEV